MKANAGFTFFGLIIIIMALSIATASLFLAIAPADRTRRVNLTYQRANKLEAAVKKYKLHNGNAAPATLNDLVTTTGVNCVAVNNTSSPNWGKLTGWCGPYIDRPVAGDPTSFQTDGFDVTFQFTGTVIRSCGPDKTCGNADDISFTNF